MRSELNYSILICDFIFIIIILILHLVSRNVLNRFYSINVMTKIFQITGNL